LFPQPPLSYYNVKLTGVTDTAKGRNIANYAESSKHERQHYTLVAVNKKNIEQS
jgi:hypothetical protein